MCAGSAGRRASDAAMVKKAWCWAGDEMLTSCWQAAAMERVRKSSLRPWFLWILGLWLCLVFTAPGVAQQARHRPGPGVVIGIDAAWLYELWQARERASHAFSTRRSSARFRDQQAVGLFHCEPGQSLIVSAGWIDGSAPPDYTVLPIQSCREGEGLYVDPRDGPLCLAHSGPLGVLPPGPAELLFGTGPTLSLLGECVTVGGALYPARVLADTRTGMLPVGEDVRCADGRSSVRFRGRLTAGGCDE